MTKAVSVTVAEPQKLNLLFFRAALRSALIANLGGAPGVLETGFTAPGGLEGTTTLLSTIDSELGFKLEQRGDDSPKWVVQVTYVADRVRYWSVRIRLYVEQGSNTKQVYPVLPDKDFDIDDLRQEWHADIFPTIRAIVFKALGLV